VRAVDDEDVDEAHESILSIDLLKAQLARLLRGRGGQASAYDPFVSLSGDEPSVQVRRTYQALLAWAAAQGEARAPGMTPERYQRRLSDAFPAHGAQFGVITTAYTNARYAAAPVSAEHAQAASAAWQQILSGADARTPT
jgi:hypothetical protein